MNGISGPLPKVNQLAKFKAIGNPFDGKKVGSQKILPAMSQAFRLQGPTVMPAPLSKLAFALGYQAAASFRFSNVDGG